MKEGINMRKSLSVFLSAVSVGIMTLFWGGLAASAAPNAEVIRYRDAPLDNILKLDFEGNGRDTVDSTAISTTSSFTTVRTWLADDVSPTNEGIAIDNTTDGYTYAAVSNVGGNTGHVLALSKGTTDANNNYIRVIPKHVCPMPHREQSDRLILEKNGFMDLSFDFYPSTQRFLRVSVSYLYNGTDSYEGNSVSWGKPIFNVDTSGLITLFNNAGGGKTFNISSAMDFDTEYFGHWHTCRLILTGDNRYMFWLDDYCFTDEPKTISPSSGNLWSDASKYFKGFEDIRFINTNSTATSSTTNYFDNIKLRRSVIHLQNTDAEVGRSISYNDTAVPILYADPNWTVSKFLTGFSGTWCGETISSFSVLNSSDSALSNGSYMSDAAYLQISTASGYSKKLDVRTSTGTSTLFTNSETVTEAEEYSTKNSASYGTWAFPLFNSVDRGFSLTKTGGIGNKSASDYALQVSASAATLSASNKAAYLDVWLEPIRSVRVESAHAPLTAEFSVFIPYGCTDTANFQFQIERTDNTTRTPIHIYGNGDMKINGTKVTTIETGRWHRVSVRTFPNSSNYIVYLNGLLMGSDNTNIAPQVIKRYRFNWSDTASATDGFAIDDVSFTQGVYTPGFTTTYSNSSGTYTATAASKNNVGANLTNAALILAEYDNSGRLIRATRAKGDPTMAASTLSCTLSGVTGTVKRLFWDLQSVQSLD